MAEEGKRQLKVFLCHASGDKPSVRELYKRLVAEGVDAWLDQEKLLPGQDWRVEIPRAVKEADVVVICLSNKSITKEGYVQKEIRFALDSAEEKPEGTIFLIPARLEDCVVPDGLNRWQWVDLFDQNGFTKLLRSLKLRADKVGAMVEPISYFDSDEEQKRRLEQLYTEGLAAFYTEDWDKACRRFQAILSEQPNHRSAAEKLAEAELQRSLAKLYAQATEAVQSEDWQVAIKALEELSQKSAAYKNVAQLLGNARKQKQLRDLYAEAKTLHAAQKWQAVVRVFEQISVIEPNYPDPDRLLTSAQKEVAELKRMDELNGLYSQGIHKIDEGQWYEARSLLEQVHKAQTGFLETERLLRKVENEITKIEELNQRNIHINTLYEQAHELVRSKNWRKALEKIEEIRKLDEQFLDKDGIIEKVKAELEREEQVIQRQNELAAMYAEAVRLLKDGKYQEALNKWQDVKSIDPKYPDRQRVQGIARKKLAETSKSVEKKRTALPIKTRRWFLIFGVVLSILIGVAGLILYQNLPPTLPECTYSPNLNDPLLVESKRNSFPVFVDGKISYPSEWADAKCYQVRFVVQPAGQGCGSGDSSVPFEWYLLNDEQRLYMLVRFLKRDFTPTGIHFSYFYPYPLVGEWQFSDSMAFFDSKAIDQYGWNAARGSWSNDVSEGGTMDTRASSSQDDQSYWFEFSKPLDSGDNHDWIWKPGDRIGTDLTGDLVIGSFGTTSAERESYGCRLIQLQLAK